MGTTVSDNMDEYKFEEWLRSAKPGAKLEYYRGHIAYDREGTVQIGEKVAHVYHEPLNSLADAVWKAYRMGKVELTQTRDGPASFRYFVIKRRQRQ